MIDRFDATHYEVIQGRVRGLLIGVSNLLHPDQLVLIEELIDSNESGVALDLLVRTLLERSASVDNETKERLNALVRDLELDEETENRVQALTVQS